MPDGDIYSKSVPRPWVEVSRLVFGRQDYESATTTTVKVLSRALSEVDCVAASEAIRAIAQAMHATSDLPSRRAFVRNLDQYTGTLPQSHVEALQRVAQRTLFGRPSPIDLSVPRGVWEDASIRIGVDFLSELTLMNIAPASKAARLARAGRGDAADFSDQIEKFSEHFWIDPGVQKLASNLVRIPGSLSQRKGVPRLKRPRLSQRELLDIAIG
jgi:hypothetical protein